MLAHRYHEITIEFWKWLALLVLAGALALMLTRTAAGCGSARADCSGPSSIERSAW